MKKQNVYRISFYILGLLILAMGLTLNTKAGLGVSPIISVSYSISTIFHLNFGDMTLDNIFCFCSSGAFPSQHTREAEESPWRRSPGSCTEKGSEADSAHGYPPDSLESYFYKIFKCVWLSAA